jgi:hypothetical protein
LFGADDFFALVMTVRDRERYLVSNHGADVAWVQNVKAAASRAVLRHGRTEHVRLEELAIEKRAPVLKAHLRRAPGARPHIPVDKDAPLAEFEAIAARIPVFRVLCASETIVHETGNRITVTEAGTLAVVGRGEEGGSQNDSGGGSSTFGGGWLRGV